MTDLFGQAIIFLQAIGYVGGFYLVLPLLLFEFPRYSLLFLISAFTYRAAPKVGVTPSKNYTVIVAGHNEAGAMRDMAIGLREQSLPPSQILVVSDGSTDHMRQELREIYEDGLIQGYHHLDLRTGKAAATNLAVRYAENEFVVVIDCDCSFDRHAMKSILEPFSDSRVGVVSGNIVPRNGNENLLTRFQAIEYGISISLGRQATDLLDQVSIASGAFGAFRRDALDDTFGFDAAGGEDLDVTLKLRQRGWVVRFAPMAICYTDVPAHWGHMIDQRLRWERDAVAIRLRKYSESVDPRDRRFDPIEAIHHWEFILFNIFAALVTPIYLLFLYVWFESAMWIALFASYILLILHDILILLIAESVTHRVRLIWHLPVMPLYSIYNILFMRNLRLYAYIDEWLFRGSLRSTYVPAKIRNYLKENS